MNLKRWSTPPLVPALLAALLVAGAVGQPDRSPSVRPKTRRTHVAPAPVRAPHAMVASTSGTASRVGAGIMQRGGNAVDAAVAVGLALAVTYPSAGNLGGGGFMLIRKADGKATVIDFRETAPARAHRGMYLDPQGNLIPDASTTGHLAAGVPGTVAGLGVALEQHGTLKWEDAVEPARKLAADGFPVSPALARSLRRWGSFLEQFPETKRVLLRDGAYYEAGQILRQPDLAATLRRLQEQGPREFYEGRTAELVAQDMQANGGLITLEDLKSYRAVVRQPLRGTYRGHEILTMPPPSSGGIALLEMLNMLERFPLARMGPRSDRKYHLMIEAMRRAFADRAEFLGDPAFARVPVAGLTSKRYAAELLKGLNPDRATPSARISHGNPAPYESPQTTHYSVIDAQGNAVSVTYTLNGSYGSGTMVRGAGFLLNNEMDDFTTKPGAPNMFGLIQGEANTIAPGKRPLSSMTPTIILRDGRFLAAIGSPGGPTIINSVLQVTVNLVDHRMNLQEAIAAPRLHHQWLPDSIRHEPGLPRDLIAALKARGHRFAEQPGSIGDVQGVMLDPKSSFRLGASDPRSADGRAVGY